MNVIRIIVATISGFMSGLFLIASIGGVYDLMTSDKNVPVSDIIILITLTLISGLVSIALFVKSNKVYGKSQDIKESEDFESEVYLRDSGDPRLVKIRISMASQTFEIIENNISDVYKFEQIEKLKISRIYKLQKFKLVTNDRTLILSFYEDISIYYRKPEMIDVDSRPNADKLHKWLRANNVNFYNQFFAPSSWSPIIMILVFPVTMIIIGLLLILFE